MGTKTRTTQKANSTTTNAPPAFTAPGLSDVASRVTQAVGQLPTTPYTGDFFAVPDQATTDNIVGAYTGAAGQARDAAAAVRSRIDGFSPITATFNTSLPTESFQLAPQQDTDAVIRASLEPVRRQLLEQILPSIRSSALDSGAYSNDRALATLPGQAIRDSDEAAQRLAAQIAYDDYNRREDRRLSAFEADQNRLLAGFQADTDRGLGSAGLVANQNLDFLRLLPELNDATLRYAAGEGDLYAQAQAAELQRKQTLIDDALAKNDYRYKYPFQGLDTAANLLAVLSGNYGTQTGKSDSTTTTKTSGLGPILQGIAGIGAAVAGIPGIGGAGVGAAGAGAAGNAVSAGGNFGSGAKLFGANVYPKTLG